VGLKGTGVIGANPKTGELETERGEPEKINGEEDPGTTERGDPVRVGVVARGDGVAFVGVGGLEFEEGINSVFGEDLVVVGDCLPSCAGDAGRSVVGEEEEDR
jgi:hypothetical protein